MVSISEVRELCKRGEYEAALKQIEHAWQAGAINPQLLVLKAMCIQLSDDSQYELAEAKAALELAVEIDDQYIEALNELGWFYFNMADDAQRALPYFERAFSLARTSLSEAGTGVAKCLAEIDGCAEAVRYLELLPTQSLDESAINEARQEIEGE